MVDMARTCLRDFAARDCLQKAIVVESFFRTAAIHNPGLSRQRPSNFVAVLACTDEIHIDTHRRQ